MVEQTVDTADDIDTSDPVTTAPGGAAEAVSDDAVSARWACQAARAAATKTADEVVVLQVGEVLGITGYFVICSGRNTRQVKTLAVEIEKQVAEAGGPKPRQIEGRDSANWILLDYGDFVVHVFLDEIRQFYELERLWADVPRVDWRAEPSSSPDAAPAE